MKIVVFLYSMGCGGAERVTANLCNYWSALGRKITLVTLTEKDTDFYDIAPHVDRISLGLTEESDNFALGLWHNFKRIRAFRRILKELQPDYAIAMMTTSSIILALAAMGLSVRTVGCEHNHPPQNPKGFVWETLRRYTYGLLDTITALTDQGKNWLEHSTRAKKVITLPNPVVWPLQILEPRLNPAEIYPTGKKKLLSVGRLCDEKAFHLLIEAFAFIADKHPDWCLTIVGEGALRAELEKQIHNLNLKDKIFLPGRAGNIGEWYESADLFVMSSRSEGFPMTLVEAMSYGLPAVSFDCDTGPRDIISHEINGLLVKPGDAVGLAQAMDTMMSDEKLRSQYSRQAVTVRDTFSLNKIAYQWEKIFEAISK